MCSNHVAGTTNRRTTSCRALDVIRNEHRVELGEPRVVRFDPFETPAQLALHAAERLDQLTPGLPVPPDMAQIAAKLLTNGRRCLAAAFPYPFDLHFDVAIFVG